MIRNWLMSVSLAVSSAALLAPATRADVVRPGSLLVFPAFDNTRGFDTFFTVTNTNGDQLDGAVDVEFVYINAANCTEFNRTRHLTPNDEITVVTKYDDPNQHKGYCYVFAKSPTTGKAIAFDHLVGTSLFIGGFLAYEIPPYVFHAGPGLAQGAETDLDHDGHRDLDGVEYEPVPDELVVPSFIGVSSPPLIGANDDLILINLTGGAQFTALVDFLVYNDNEEVFSAQYSFQCWTRVPLLDISGVFLNDFLLTTNQDPNEVFNGGNPVHEFGWFRIDGNVATSSAASFPDPAILAARTILLGFPTSAQTGSLPFGIGSQTNGSLLSHNLLGT